jgi:hypothetical protein
VPDLAFQFSICLEQDLRGQLFRALRTAFGPNSDIQIRCRQGSERFGIWLSRPVNEAAVEARNRGMDRLEIIGANESIAFFINRAPIRSRAVAEWDRSPKRLDGDGKPDPEGPIHLTGFSPPSFERPDRVVTRVTGFDERAWPDVDFTLTITDRLTISAQELQCETTNDLDVDASWIHFLAGVFLVASNLRWVSLIPAAIFAVQGIIIAAQDAPDPDGGPGCAAAALIPKEVLIEGGNKIVIFHRRVDVAAGGIFVGGAFLPVPRSPAVTITGPRNITAAEGAAKVTRRYILGTDELREPLRVRWTADGTVGSQGQDQTFIRFDVTGAQGGDVLTKRVSVSVTDVDDLIAEAEIVVRIDITFADDDDDLPPVCRVKPSLPQCNEPIRAAVERRRRRT